MSELVRVLAVSPAYNKPKLIHIENSEESFEFFVGGKVFGIDFYDTITNSETNIAIVCNRINLEAENPYENGYELAPNLPEHLDVHGDFFFIGFERKEGISFHSKSSYTTKEDHELFQKEEDQEFRSRAFRSISDTEIKRIYNYIRKLRIREII